MNNFNAEDIQLLYWHAMNKMRSGQFHSAAQFMRYVYEVLPSFHVGLGLAYCYYREGHVELAKNTLIGLVVPEQGHREKRMYDRLLKRVSR